MEAAVSSSEERIQRLRTLGAQIQQKLVRAEDAEDFTENFVHPLQSLDERGNLLWCNRTWCEEFGYSQEEAIGMNIAALVDPKDRGVEERLFEGLKQGEVNDHPVVIRFLHRDGKSVPYLVASNARFEGGRFHSTRCLLIRKSSLNGCLSEPLDDG